jgi:hypothetical protein
VTRGDPVGPQTARALQQCGEFQIAVAVRTRERGASRRILADEVGDDLRVELALEVQNIVRDIDRRRHAPGIVQVVERAAAAEMALAVGLRRKIVELHRHTDDVVPLCGK